MSRCICIGYASLYCPHILLMSVTRSCMWGRLHSLCAASQWTCSETVYLCWKQSPFHRCLLESLFPVVLWPIWDPFCCDNGSFVHTYTASLGTCPVFSAIIFNPSPARPVVTASSERDIIESMVNAVKWGWGRGFQELDSGADKFHTERVNMFLSCYLACTLTHGMWRRWKRARKDKSSPNLSLWLFPLSVLCLYFCFSFCKAPPCTRKNNEGGQKYEPFSCTSWNECAVITYPNVLCLKSGFLQQGSMMVPSVKY